MKSSVPKRSLLKPKKGGACGKGALVAFTRVKRSELLAEIQNRYPEFFTATEAAENAELRAQKEKEKLAYLLL